MSETRTSKRPMASQASGRPSSALSAVQSVLFWWGACCTPITAASMCWWVCAAAIGARLFLSNRLLPVTKQAETKTKCQEFLRLLGPSIILFCIILILVQSESFVGFISYPPIFTAGTGGAGTSGPSAQQVLGVARTRTYAPPSRC